MDEIQQTSVFGINGAVLKHEECKDGHRAIHLGPDPTPLGDQHDCETLRRQLHDDLSITEASDGNRYCRKPSSKMKEAERVQANGAAISNNDQEIAGVLPLRVDKQGFNCYKRAVSPKGAGDRPTPTDDERCEGLNPRMSPPRPNTEIQQKGVNNVNPKNDDLEENKTSTSAEGKTDFGVHEEAVVEPSRDLKDNVPFLSHQSYQNLIDTSIPPPPIDIELPYMCSPLTHLQNQQHHIMFGEDMDVNQHQAMLYQTHLLLNAPSNSSSSQGSLNAYTTSPEVCGFKSNTSVTSCPSQDSPASFGHCHMMSLNDYRNFKEEAHGFQTFVYPSIYVSVSGLITVLLKHDVSVEMTFDRTIRVVSHNSKMAVATNSRGTASIMHHPVAKVFQENTTTDAEIYGVKAKMTTENIVFGSGKNCYRFDYDNIEAASVRFADVSVDKSVNLLFASEGYGSTLVPQCLHIAGLAEYEDLPKGGVIIRINGVKITQTGAGDVSVVSGPKFMKVSPSLGAARLNTHFTEITVDKGGVVYVRRGNHTIDSSQGMVVLSNGKIEAGLDEDGGLNVYNLPKISPREVAKDQRKHRPGNPRRKATALGGAAL